MSRVYEEDFFVKASVERVWQALTTPAEMEKWLGMKVLSFEPRQGGRIEVDGLSGGSRSPRSRRGRWAPSGMPRKRAVLSGSQSRR